MKPFFKIIYLVISIAGEILLSNKINAQQLYNISSTRQKLPANLINIIRDTIKGNLFTNIKKTDKHVRSILDTVFHGHYASRSDDYGNKIYFIWIKENYIFVSFLLDGDRFSEDEICIFKYNSHPTIVWRYGATAFTPQELIDNADKEFVIPLSVDGFLPR